MDSDCHNEPFGCGWRGIIFSGLGEKIALFGACGVGGIGVDWRCMIRRSAAEQTAAHLLAEVERGRWRGLMPGVNRLAAELGISRETVRAALQLLEEGGSLAGTGDGRARRIVAGGGGQTPQRKGLRVGVLLRQGVDEEGNTAFLRLVLRIQYRLEKEGHVCVFAPKSMQACGSDAARIIRMVQKTEADLWLILLGTLEVLQWFAGQPLPALALGGRIRGLAVAGASRKPLPAFQQAWRELFGMGHRRVVLLSPRDRRLPTPCAIERAFQEEMTAHGLPFGDFNLPDWEPTPEGLEALLRELFRVTPPTVIQAYSPEVAVGVLSFLHRRGLRVPEHVSVVCEYMENTLAWHRPALAHFATDYEMMLRRVVRWVEGVAKGRIDHQQFSTKAVFKPGESIAPPRS